MSAMDVDDDFMNDSDAAEDYDTGSDAENGEEDYDEDYDEDEEEFATGDGFEPVIADKDIKKAYEVDWKVHSTADITAFQNEEVAHVAGILGCLPEHAATLLRQYKWNKERLIERYVEDPEGESEKAGVVVDTQKQPKFTTVKGFECPICCNDDEDLETIALHCAHRFCRDCYEHYLKEKIAEQGESRRIQCMEAGCKLVVDENTVHLLVSEEVHAKYRSLLIRTYVDDSPFLRWCPAPDCEYAIECHVAQTQLAEIVPTVKCNCGHVFCFGCGLPDHKPCICPLVRFWLKKCADDSETANWLSANTKECTKCASTIEKNGGCNHMTCKKCKYEFCWVCLGPWVDHGTQWYNCNRFDEKASIDARDSQAKSRRQLERYLHYYNRYANHDRSANFGVYLIARTAKYMADMQSASSLSWIEVQFLRKALDELLESRMVLKWTYCFAYYLARDNMTALFEDNQRDLEVAVENLNELLEKPIFGAEAAKVFQGLKAAQSSSSSDLASTTTTTNTPAPAPGIEGTTPPNTTTLADIEDRIRNLRQQVLDKMGYVKHRREVLLRDTAQGLKERRWTVIVDMKTGMMLD
ncbi:ariadne-1 [Fimicolochytrium jonesii]|uniref:ariadne-1 n=1 Tax=Fimicolochytrium jonesii TaxID=1396493 RepID=UPI0022FEF561|nr:ariadne-1 [Fimicolochytrium jonesii]KAI8819881.1 ariadne-1 [Fimicolochytrium jonesii]